MQYQIYSVAVEALQYIAGTSQALHPLHIDIVEMIHQFNTALQYYIYVENNHISILKVQLGDGNFYSGELPYIFLFSFITIVQ